jgi:hypothetical protein
MIYIEIIQGVSKTIKNRHKTHKRRILRIDSLFINLLKNSFDFISDIGLSHELGSPELVLFLKSMSKYLQEYLKILSGDLSITTVNKILNIFKRLWI